MKKNILFFTYDFPYPTDSGGKVRAFNLMKFAKGHNSITLFSFTREGFKQEHKKELEAIGVKDIYLFKRAPLKSIRNIPSMVSFSSSIFKSLYYKRKIEEMLIKVVQDNKIDVIHFESFYTSYYLNDVFKKMNVKQIYGTENLEYKNYEAFVKKIPVVMNIPFKLQVKNLQKDEEKFARLADVTLAVTEDEAHQFEKMGAAKTVVIPNGVDTEYFAFKPSKRPQGEKILFVGNFSYFPNREGITYFYNEVFKKMEGRYTLVIIGKGASSLGIHDTRVGIQEYVEDIRGAYYAADVLVSPIQIGGGTNFKIIEAMACGLPVLADPTRIGALKLTPDENVMTAQNPEEFQTKLEILLRNDGIQGKLARNARDHIVKNYSWEVIGKKLEGIWDSV